MMAEVNKISGSHASVIPASSSACPKCQKIYKTQNYPSIVSTNRNLIGTKHKRIAEPHLCGYDMLFYIRGLYNKKWISPDLYYQWMDNNCGMYKTNGHPDVMLLWKARITTLIEAKVSNELKYIKSLESEKVREALSNTSHPWIKCDVCVRHTDPPIKHVRVVELIKRVGGRHVKLTRSGFKILNSMFPFSSDADKAKTNMDVASMVFGMCDSGLVDLVNEVLSLLPVGSYNITVVAFLIHAAGNPVFRKVMNMMIRDKACCMMSKTLHTYFKSVTTALRRTLKWYDGTEAPLELIVCGSYWELCIGRSKNISDWAEERIKRTKMVEPLRLLSEEKERDNDTNNDYLLRLDKVLDDIMIELISIATKWTTWEEFGERRQSWVASGSAGPKYINVDGEKVRLSKPAYFETVTPKEFNEFLESNPAIYASGSEKMEQSKARAIYGTAPLDYAVMSYVIMPLEYQFHNIEGVESSLRGIDEIASVWRRIDNVSNEESVECMMVDYTDFNYQHTLQAQSAVFKAVGKRVSCLYTSSDVVKAAKWCELALLNQYCKFPGDRKYSKITQGMFSGVRGTNFLNTILNVAYFRLASTEVKESFDLEPRDLYNLHSGDDVWISNKDRLWTIAMYNCMKYCGFAFNDAKQLFAQNTGEFLRVWYTKEGARGYLGRAIGSLIQRPIQGSDLLLPGAQASALNDQINLLFRRGLSKQACDILWKNIIPHALTFRINDEEHCSIPISVAKKRHVDGGLDLGPPLTKAAPCDKTKSPPAIDNSENKVAKEIAYHSSDAWIRVMSKEIGESFNAPSIKETLHNANSMGSMCTGDKMKNSIKFISRLKKWLVTLEKCKVIRNEKIYEDWLLSAPEELEPVDKMYSMLTATSLKDKRVVIEIPMIATIFSAISQSPFKDLSTAKQATGLNTIMSALTACLASANASAGSRASETIQQLRLMTSDEITTSILNSEYSHGNGALSALNPVTLSWCTHLAIEETVKIAIMKRITTLQEWEDLLCETVDIYVAYITSRGSWLSLCRY